jgi:hypothetical protein
MGGKAYTQDQELEADRYEYTKKLLEALNKFRDALAKNDLLKKVEFQSKVTSMLAEPNAAKNLDLESQFIQEGLKQYFENIIEDKDAYLAFVKVLQKISIEYKIADLKDLPLEYRKSLLLFQYIVDKNFGVIKKHALSPVREWHKELLGIMTAGKILYDGYRELPAEVKEILFPEKRLVANHFFDFSPYLFAEVADSYNKQKRAGQVLRAIDKDADVGSVAMSTAAEPYSSSPRSSLVVTAKQVAGYLFHKATSSKGASAHDI